MGLKKRFPCTDWLVRDLRFSFRIIGLETIRMTEWSWIEKSFKKLRLSSIHLPSSHCKQQFLHTLFLYVYSVIQTHTRKFVGFCLQEDCEVWYLELPISDDSLLQICRRLLLGIKQVDEILLQKEDWSIFTIVNLIASPRSYERRRSTSSWWIDVSKSSIRSSICKQIILDQTIRHVVIQRVTQYFHFSLQVLNLFVQTIHRISIFIHICRSCTD